MTPRPTAILAVALVMMCGLSQHAHCATLALRGSSPSSAPDLSPVYDLIQRIFPAETVPFFTVSVDPSLSSDVDVFSLSGGGSAGNVTVTGSSLTAVTAGLGWYLKHVANCSVAWSGKQMALPVPVPAVPSTTLTVKASVQWRYYLNTCTHSYSMAFWTWDRWQQEIDWMALQGLNMPLAFTGQEALWYDLFLQYNVTAAELDAWFTGPAMLAWWRMGNIQNYLGPLDANWRANRLALQKQILPRMRSLGMTTVLPGFAGHVPAGLMRAFPDAKITRSALWAGFNGTYSGDYLLDAADPLFASLANSFTKLLATEMGTDHVYNADTFNEMIPASNDTTYLKNLASDLYKSLAVSDPDAVWMIQGWMFSFDANFWKPAQIKAYLSGIPPHKMIILDLNAFLDPIWSKTESFYNTDFIWCIIDNAGGRPGMFGDLNRVTSGPPVAKANSTSMVGIGIAPEGIQQNPITFELMAEMGWRDAAVDLPSWVENYVRRRYGPAAPQALYDAWAIMLPNLYNNMGQHFSAMFADTPSLNMGGYSSWTDPTAMVQVWRLFHSAADDVSDVDPFLFDYVDVTRQAMSYVFEDVYLQVVAAYKLNDTRGLSAVGPALLQMVEDIDAVLATHPMWMVGGWLNAARDIGSTTAESDAYEVSARRLITIWGPDGQLNGYATRQMAGLNKDFHGPHWKLFLDRLNQSISSKTAFDQGQFDQDCFDGIELPWTNSHNPYPSKPTTDTLTVIDTMFNKYAGPVDSHSLSYEYRIHPDSDGNGGLWGNMRMQLNDPATGEFLCSINPDCGGFVADGWYKELYAEPVPYPGSTFYRRVESTCRAVDCSEPTTGATDCNARCDCFWDPAQSTCGCVGMPDHPSCEQHYPAPTNTSVLALASVTSPLRSDDRIALFGDSITWLGGYIGLLKEALATTPGLNNITLSNHGINGGMVKDIKNGGTVLDETYPSFAQVLEEEKPTIITIFIGINDVWFPSSSHHSDPDPFKETLTELVQAGRASGATVVLYTLSVHGELTTGTQYFDANMTLYTNLIKDVAQTTNTPVGDMHANYLAYERQYNTVPSGGIAKGVLTVDGVHPCWGGKPSAPCPMHTHGNYMISNTIADGLLVALADRN